MASLALMHMTNSSSHRLSHRPSEPRTTTSPGTRSYQYSSASSGVSASLKGGCDNWYGWFQLCSCTSVRNTTSPCRTTRIEQSPTLATSSRRSSGRYLATMAVQLPSTSVFRNPFCNICMQEALPIAPAASHSPISFRL